MSRSKVLLVDDDVISNFLFEKYVADLADKVHLDIALNGKEGIEYLQRNEGTFPRIIFLDINMPLVNGFRFLELYRQHGYEGRSSIIMYSTSNVVEDIQKAESYQDVKTYLVKPVVKDRILSIIVELIEAK